MKVLISGITGFIGINVAKRLKEQGVKVCAIVRPDSSPKDIKRLSASYFVDQGSTPALCNYFKREKPEGVIHLASRYLVRHNSKDVGDLIDSNVRFATRLLEGSAGSGVRWFINTGTFWQHYGNRAYSPVNLYAATKQAFEAIARYYYESHDLDFVTIKLNDTYGPGDPRPKILNFWNGLAGSGKTIPMSPGRQYLDLTYIDDVVAAYLRMVRLLGNDRDKKLRGRIFAVRSGRALSLRELANIFSKVTGKKLNIHWGAVVYRPRQVMSVWDKGKKIPGWKPRVSLEQGIARTFGRRKYG